MFDTNIIIYILNFIINNKHGVYITMFVFTIKFTCILAC